MCSCRQSLDARSSRLTGWEYCSCVGTGLRLEAEEGCSYCRNAEGFVGLKNGSATCYMNAVFQQLFMAPGVRTAVLSEPEEPEAARRESVFYQMQVHDHYSATEPQWP